MVGCGTACCSLPFHQSLQQAHQRHLPATASPCSCSLPQRHLSAAAAASSCSSSFMRLQQHEDADTALLALLRAHDTDAAFAIFVAQPDILPCSSVTASRLLAQLSLRSNSSSSFTRAAAVLQSLRARNALSLLDANALSLAAAAAARSGNANLAHSLILYMLRQGLFPDRRAYTAVVSRLSPPSKAVRLFQAVLHQSREQSVPTSSVPDTAAFNVALNACADAGDSRAFRNLFDEMASTCSPDAVTFNIVIKMCARAGRRDLVARVLHRMLSAGVTPCATTFHSLVAAFVGFGDIPTAETIVQAMRQGGSSKDISSFLITGAASYLPSTQADAPDAVLLEDIVLVAHPDPAAEQGKEAQNNPPLPKPNARVYTTLMKGYMNAGRVDDVLATLRAMQHEAKTIPASRPDQVTFTTVISALVAAGDMERAHAVLKEMADEAVPANCVTYNVLIKGYCQHLQINRAKQLFFQMKEEDKIGTPSPDVVTFNILMDGCVLMDDTADALALFNEMRSRGIAPTTVSYTTLMKAFALSGQPKLAHKVFHEMEMDPRVTVDRAAWNMLVEAYCRLGLIDTAKQLVETMRNKGGFEPDTATYGSLAKGIAVARKPGEALLLWNEVKERCPDPDEELLEALADVCVRAAFFKKALEIVACMEERGIAPKRAKYKKMYIEMHSRMFTSKHASQARQDRRRERKRAAEAFKFWLGLPNEYYGTNTSDWRPIDPLGDQDDL